MYIFAEKEEKPPTLPPKGNISPDSKLKSAQAPNASTYQNVQFTNHETQDATDTSPNEKTRSLTRKGFLKKFRRSISLSPESANELTQNLGNKPNSTFYITETINIDSESKEELSSGNDSGLPSSPVQKSSRSSLARPQSPPPPIPVQNIGEYV